MKDLFTLLGFVAAGFCFFTWYGGQQSNNGQLAQNEIATAEASIAGLNDYAERKLGNTMTSSKKERADADKEPIAAALDSRSSVSAAAIKKDVQQLSDVAIENALERQVPPGVSFALLIYSAEKGKQMNVNNLKKVMDYLVSVKQNADEKDLKTYFKYASNSGKWFQGLGLARNGGHPKAALLRIYDAYDLKRYDDDIYNVVTKNAHADLSYDAKITPKTKIPAMAGDATTETVRSNHAYAVNRWADKESKGTKAETKFLPAAEPASSSFNTIRKKVLALEVGQSLSFSKPEEYHIAVKEMIALENGYPSWVDYEEGVGKSKAAKVFRKRAEKGGFMATGGLKLTREI